MNKTYLAHHGVKGQKWGVQHGPPYPLDEKGKKALARGIQRDTNIYKSRVMTSREDASGGLKEKKIVEDHIKANVSPKRKQELENIVKKMSEVEPYSDEEIDVINEFADWEIDLWQEVDDMLDGIRDTPISIVASSVENPDLIAKMHISLGSMADWAMEDMGINMLNEMLEKYNK